MREPCVTNFEEIRKRMEELGIKPVIKPVIPPGTENGVAVEPPKEPKPETTVAIY